MDQYSQWDNLPSSGNYSPNDPDWGRPDPNPGRYAALTREIIELVQDLITERLKNFRCDHQCPCTMIIGGR